MASKSKKPAKAKTSKAKAAKKEVTPISAKQYGRNIVMIVDGEKYSRAFNEKSERDEILLSVESYNAKPTVKLRDSILSTMLHFEKEKEVKAAKVEEAKKTLKAPAKVAKPKKAISNEEEIEQAKQLLEAANYVVSKPASRRRGGEY